jgi:hypothetical protein
LDAEFAAPAYTSPDQTVNLFARTEVNTMNLTGETVGWSMLDQLLTNQASNALGKMSEVAVGAGLARKFPNFKKLDNVPSGIGGAVNYFDYEDSASAYIAASSVKSVGEFRFW